MSQPVAPAGQPLPSTAPAGAPASGQEGVVVGLDIGGSKTHGAVWRDGVLVAEARAGSANVQNVTPSEAAASLATLFRSLLPHGPEGVGHIVAGSGGVDTATDAGRLRAVIEPHAPGAVVDVVHDTRLILAAGGARAGIAVIAGTGSVAWGLAADGRAARSGGWGYLLGDEGSGYWVAREAVRRALHRHDVGLAPDALDTAVLARNGVATPTELIGLFHSGPEASRTYWAAQASEVFDAVRAGHEDAGRILDEAAADITRLVLDVVSVIGLPGPVVLGGGLATHQPALQERIGTRLRAVDIVDVMFLAQDPVMGVPFLLSGQ